MAEETRYAPIGQPRVGEMVTAWTIVVLFVADVALLGYVAWSAWNVSRASEATFALLREQGKTACVAASATGAPMRYENADWNVSFELPPGFTASEERLSDAGDVDLRISRTPAQGTRASANTTLDTGVRVRIGPATGFDKYYSRPYTEYAAYHRFTAVGRPAAGWTDPADAAENQQVIVIDDSRYDREVTVIYKGVVADAESLAKNIMDSMRLTAREQQKIVVKPGWKVFSQDPVRFQYPEDYRVTAPVPGRLEIQGKGGRIVIFSAYSVGQNARPSTNLGATGAGQGNPDEFFDLQYGVDMRVQFYYASDATSYDRSVLKDISSTITFNQ